MKPDRSAPVVRACEIPPQSLLRRYQDGAGFADCYAADVPGTVTQQAFIEAFYTSRLFKLERTILHYLASKPATDADARVLAIGQAPEFSAWKVEGQSASELLLSDFTGRTRSWLSAVPAPASGRPSTTRLHFGSAVVPRSRGGEKTPDMGWPFHALLGFHRLYSRMLLSAACRRATRI